MKKTTWSILAVILIAALGVISLVAMQMQGPDASAVLAQTDPGLRFPLAMKMGIGTWEDVSRFSGDALAQRGLALRVAVGGDPQTAKKQNKDLVVLQPIDISQEADLINAGKSRIMQSANQAVSQGFDGVIIRDARPNTGVLSTVNPATNKPWTSAERGAAVSQIAQSFKTANPKQLVVTSQGADAVTGMDGNWFVNFVQVDASSATAYKSEADWKSEIDAFAKLSESRSQITLVSTVLPATTDEATGRKWGEYALASFLLGKQGSYSYFSFQSGKVNELTLLDADPRIVRIGEAQGAYTVQDGVYKRAYSGGLVLVNPGTEEKKVSLQHPYRYNHDLVTEITLPSHAGAVLLNP